MRSLQRSATSPIGPQSPAARLTQRADRTARYSAAPVHPVSGLIPLGLIGCCVSWTGWMIAPPRGSARPPFLHPDDKESLNESPFTCARAHHGIAADGNRHGAGGTAPAATSAGPTRAAGSARATCRAHGSGRTGAAHGTARLDAGIGRF